MCSLAYSAGHNNSFQMPGQVQGTSSTATDTTNSRSHFHKTCEEHTGESCGRKPGAWRESCMWRVGLGMCQWQLPCLSGIQTDLDAHVLRLLKQCKYTSSKFRRLQISRQGVSEVEDSLLGLSMLSFSLSCMVPVVCVSMC